MNLIGTRKMETDRLVLRPTEESDLKTLWEILSIPEVNKYYLVCKINSEWEKELPWQMKKLKHALDKDVFQWSIIEKETNECIGQISVQENSAVNDLNIRDIGWFINPSKQRKGYAYETASAVLDYMFNEVNIKGIKTSAAVVNEASWKLMEKLGFKRSTEEKHINHYTYGGEEESYSYELMSDDYLNRFHIINEISIDDYKTLVSKSGWKVLSDKQFQNALKNSMYVSVGIKDKKVIGMARLVGDYSVHGLLCDVMVLDEYRNNRYGTILVKDIMKRVKNNLGKDEQFLIELCPANGKKNFYLNCGFKYKPENMDGMYLWIKN